MALEALGRPLEVADRALGGEGQVVERRQAAPHVATRGLDQEMSVSMLAPW